jgi:hypothetical protein
MGYNNRIRVNGTLIASKIFPFCVRGYTKSSLLAGLKHTIHYCYLKLPYCAIAHQNLILQPNCNQPLPIPHLSSSAWVTTL